MKLDKVYIPVTSLETGDIIKLNKNHFKFLNGQYRYANLNESAGVSAGGENDICFSVVMKSEISSSGFNSTWVLYGSTENGEIAVTQTMSHNICVEIIQHCKKIVLPCFVRNLEIEDCIFTSNTTLGYISSLEYYGYGNVKISYYYLNSHGFQDSFKANFNDLVIAPIDSFGPLVSESESFLSNFEMLIENSANIHSLPDWLKAKRLCTWRLFDACNEKSEYIFHDAALCFNCLKKTAALAVYSNAYSIQKYKCILDKYLLESATL